MDGWMDIGTGDEPRSAFPSKAGVASIECLHQLCVCTAEASILPGVVGGGVHAALRLTRADRHAGLLLRPDDPQRLICSPPCFEGASCKGGDSLKQSGMFCKHPAPWEPCGMGCHGLLYISAHW